MKGVTADIGFGDLANKVEKKGQRSEVSEGSMGVLDCGVTLLERASE